MKRTNSLVPFIVFRLIKRKWWQVSSKNNNFVSYTSSSEFDPTATTREAFIRFNYNKLISSVIINFAFFAADNKQLVFNGDQTVKAVFVHQFSVTWSCTSFLLVSCTRSRHLPPRNDQLGKPREPLETPPCRFHTPLCVQSLSNWNLFYRPKRKQRTITVVWLGSLKH